MPTTVENTSYLHNDENLQELTSSEMILALEKPDNDEKACLDAQRNIGAHSHYVQGRRGLVDADLQAVRAWMDARVVAARKGHAAERGTVLLPDRVLLQDSHEPIQAGAPPLRRAFTQTFSAPQAFSPPWRARRPPGSSS